MHRDAGRNADASSASHFFETSRLVEAGLFILFFVLVVSISFLGQKPKGPQLVLNEIAPTRIVAEFPFSYESQVLVEQRIQAVRAQVPPVFQRTFEPFDAFQTFLNDLNALIARTQIEFEDEGSEALLDALEASVVELVQQSALEIDPQVIVELVRQNIPNERSSLFNDALKILRELYEDGIYANPSTSGEQAGISVIQLLDEAGRSNLPEARSLEEARVALRVRLNALSDDSATARTLFEVFGAGLKPNLVYNARGTNRAIERAVASIEPPTVEFETGDTLIEPNSVVGREAIERLDAYREVEAQRGGDSLVFNDLFMQRVALTALLLSAIVIYVKQGFRDVYKRNRAIAITAVSILLNLLIIRLIIELGEISLVNSQASLSLLPFFAPFALAPIIVAVLVGAVPAVLSALIVSVLFGIMQENSVTFMLVAFLSGVVGCFVANNVRQRSRIVRAGLVAGAATAAAGCLVSFLNHTSLGHIGQEMLVALAVGLVTGIIAVGVLPVFESLFKITTEITLLELTDFNHPLLRRMQLEAPGTYHHSLMVANLSENAAAAIGASPLLCRVCSFFHDIGKLVKPEYFVENQRGGANPHSEKNPSMSALVIKAHVKEGVELARKFKLPRVRIEVIRQHHGTSLIQYFYFQARQQRKSETAAPVPAKNGKQKEEPEVDQSTYRYDGPRPAFKESAIIFFADGVEAASRSLKKVTQPAVEELIDTLFQERIQDGQLDVCPLTFKELEQIRNSFCYTLLNMLHARVEYPKEGGNGEAGKQAIEANTRGEDGYGASASGRQQPV